MTTIIIKNIKAENNEELTNELHLVINLESTTELLTAESPEALYSNAVEFLNNNFKEEYVQNINIERRFENRLHEVCYEYVHRIFTKDYGNKAISFDIDIVD